MSYSVQYKKEQRNVRWTKAIDSTIPQSNKSFGFGMSGLFMVGALTLLPLIIFHIYELVSSYGPASKLYNSVVLYRLVSEMYSTDMVKRDALLSMLLSRDKVKLMGVNPSKVYQVFSDRMKDSIIPSLIDSASLDYGQEFNTFYRNISDKATPLMNVVNTRGTGKLNITDPYIDGTDVNFVTFIRSSLSISDEAYRAWQMDYKNQSTGLQNILGMSKVNRYLARELGWGHVKETYYIISLTLMNTIQSLVDPSLSLDSSSGFYTIESNKNKDWEYFLYFVVPISIICAVVFYFLVYKQLYITLFDFWQTAKMLPMDMMRKNSKLVILFKKMERNASSKFTFF